MTYWQVSRHDDAPDLVLVEADCAVCTTAQARELAAAILAVADDPAAGPISGKSEW